MKALTDKEIQFIKETDFTPTVIQCNEWNRTPFETVEDASAYTLYNYGFNLVDLLDKLFDDCDGISGEYNATYLFYTFFTKQELMELTPEKGLKWLQDFKYFCGYRKWDIEFVEKEINEALEIYNGTREFYETESGDIWNREKE